MTKREEVGKNEQKKRLNQTAHRRAMADPEVQKLVNVLGSQWESLSPLERGEKLSTLISFKCSMPGIAKELGKSARNMYRYLALAVPLKTDSSAIISAAPAPKKILPAQKANAGSLKISQQLLIEDSLTDVVSEQLTNLILECCRVGMPPGHVPIPIDSVPEILNAVARCLSNLEKSGAQKLPSRTWTGGPYSRSRPAEDVLQAEWIANTVWGHTRRRHVWESALKKAADRAGDPVTQKRPIEEWVDSHRESEVIVTSPMPRRPIGNARSLMKRQGCPTVPAKPD